MKRKLPVLLFALLLPFTHHAQDAGKAIMLDGVDDFISVSVSDYDFSNFTLECWVNVPTYDGNVHYMSLQQNAYLILGDYSSGVVSTWADGLTPIDAGSTGSGNQPTLATDEWHHFAFTYDGVSQRVLVDGQIVVEEATTGAVTLDNLIYNTGLIIGARYSGTTQFVQGLIDEVRIWNVARTEAQIDANKDVLINPQAGLVGYWRFDGNANDFSGNNQNGALNGGITYVESGAPIEDPFFDRVIVGEVVTDNQNNYQACWGDYNNDGYDDLFVPASNGPNTLYRNNGDGTFTTVIAGDLGADVSTSYGASWGDYDNDGDLDLFVANSGNNSLYRNNGDETFTSVIAGDLGIDGVSSYNGSWADYDNDGFIDLFTANSGVNHLYHNNGDGTFTRDVNFFITDTGTSWACAWGDYDDDGLVDLYVTNSSAANFLYKNNGGGNFTKITVGDPVTDAFTNYGVSWIDYDNDEDLDLFVPSSFANNLLYQNDGLGNFTKIVAGPLITEMGENWSASWGDYDNDGWQDVVINRNGSSALFRNQGGSFVKVVNSIISSDNGYSLGGGWNDIDRDGDLDLFVANYAGVNALYFNEGNANNWIDVKLQGVFTNADGLGAKVWVEDVFGGTRFFEVNAVNGRGQIASIHAGLGGATVKSVNVQWPSGIMQSAKPATNGTVTIGEFVTTSNRPQILIVSSEYSGYVFDVQRKLIKNGDFEIVQNFGAQNTTPSVETLSGFDAVLVWSNFMFNNSTLLGDNLADYQDIGGNVVKGMFSLYSGFDVQGRLASDYTLINTGTFVSSAATLGTVLQPDHPIMYRVNSFDGGSAAYRTNGAVADGTVIAEWSDGLPLIVVKEGVGPANSKRVDLNFRPPSADSETTSWVTSSDGGQLLINAMLWALAPPDPFSKVTTGPIVNDGGVSWGVAWGDIEGNSHLDLFVGNSGANDFLYVNNADGTFSKNSTDVITMDAANEAAAATWGDYDNDGDQDVFVADRLGNSKLYQNNGDDTFSLSIEFMEGVGSTGVAWGDYDNDGYLDLFVSSESGPNALYQNNTDGSFTPITTGEIVNESYTSYGCVWGDYDDDGNLDIFVANYGGPNSLFRNNGDGTFARISGNVEGDFDNSVTASWGDYDNDADLDLFVGNYSRINNNLYENNGDGTFTQIFNQEIVTDGSSTISSAWEDYDNDGYLDLFITNDFGQSDKLYHNNGDGTFTEIVAWAPVVSVSNSYGMAWADYNDDGYQDLYVADLSGGNNLLFQNNGSGYNWINIRLEGVLSNASAVGAKVYVTANSETQMREITAQTGFSGQSSLNAEFGLGDVTVIEEVLINWPSGVDQYLYNVDANQFITITEDAFAPSVDAEDFPSFYDLNGGTQVASITVSDDQGVSYVEVAYVGITEPSANTVFEPAVTEDGTVYTFDLSVIDTKNEALGVAYVFAVYDNAGNSTLSNVGITHVEVLGTNTPAIPRLKFGTTVTDYQIISIPLELNNNSVNAVFSDDLGALDNTKWRIFHYTNGSNIELTGTSPIDIDEGYWLIAKNAATIDVGTGSVPQVVGAEPFQLNLSSGWNQIGNPYNFDISWQEVLDFNGNPASVDTELSVYNSGFTTSDILRNFRGAFVFSTADITLDIPTLKNNAIQGRKAASQENKNPISEAEWFVDFTLKSGLLQNDLGGIGMHPESKKDKDRFDRLAVPHFIEYLEMNIEEVNFEGNAFTRSVVPTEENHTWSFTVDTNTKGDRVSIQWDNSYWGNSDKQLVLFDRTARKSVDMRLTTSYTFDFYGPRRFEVYFGYPEYIRERLTPKILELGNATPNPFVDETRVPLSLPGDDTYAVTLTVYDQLGKIIKTVTVENVVSGYHELIWNGTNNQEVRINPGIYFGRIDVIGNHHSAHTVQRLLVN